jgi:DnaD/phage-associated family protein
MERFNGFPAGASGSIRIPDLFFSTLLPLIDDLAELKVTVYCFWALQQREGQYRYVRLRDMLADQALLAGLDADPEQAIQILHAALDRCIERGTLLHVEVPTPGSDKHEHLYFMNTEKGRVAVTALERGDWAPGTPDQPVGLIVDRPNIFTLYEQNIGPLTPLLSDILRDAENTYPAAWIEDAMRIAVERNKRNWRYVEAILKGWTSEGKKEKPAATPAEDVNPYLRDEYFRRNGE